MPSTSHRHPASKLRQSAAAVLAAVVLLLGTGCSVIAPEQAREPADPAQVTDGVAEELMPFYTQAVDWKSCENGLECADIEVPLDYADAGGEKIKIAAIRSDAGGSAQGSILVNPGGPGASGYDLLRDGLQTMFSEQLRSDYDLVGFDPRGVQRSAPVTCQTDAERDQARETDYNRDSDADIERAIEDAAKLAAKCDEKTGPVLGQVDTVSAAKDMDIIRAVVGDEKLNYLGFSYGTFLGATYAGLFPERTGRMVLDGALDPALSNEQVTLGQAAAFEDAIHAYTAYCLDNAGCPMSGSVDTAVGQLRDLIRSVEESPLTAPDGRLVPVGTFVSGLLVPLYDDASWPVLTQALTTAFRGDPSSMLLLADAGAGRDQDGHYTNNTTDAFMAINCLDYPMVTDVAGMRQDAKELEQASPTIGRYLAFGGANCRDWPYEPTGERAPIHAEGAAPILVVGTTGDPATPYEWAESMAAQLDSATLLTYQGEGHTAYGRGNTCIREAVDNYFADGSMPAEGTVCS
ncbi:alpha/beta hydrolase [Arthrobacter sp. NPDC055138]